MTWTGGGQYQRDCRQRAQRQYRGLGLGCYCTSAKAIEAAVGYDLLLAVPASVQAQAEGKTNAKPTN